MDIDVALVRRLITVQFPQWAALPVRPVARGGWDNRTFHLGDRMLVRLPSAPHYAAQVEKEQRWLPVLAPLLPLAIPWPLAQGLPSADFDLPWSVYQWIDGECVASERVADRREFARGLARFLNALRRIDSTGGPPAGPHNFYRGGALSTYDAQTRQALAVLTGRIDTRAASAVWEQALASAWKHAPVWIHGDISAGNLLVHNGRLSAVIDFGNLGVGDPACDLSIAWTFFDDESREAFRTELALDDATWLRARAWALWKAAILAAGLAEADSAQLSSSWRVLEETIRGVPRA